MKLLLVFLLTSTGLHAVGSASGLPMPNASNTVASTTSSAGVLDAEVFKLQNSKWGFIIWNNGQRLRVNAHFDTKAKATSVALEVLSREYRRLDRKIKPSPTASPTPLPTATATPTPAAR
ncbi:hypothetical protein KGP36_02585 [Patescibacteria group bacterium]|nr:hypothetical protein [Patescibacteria group bacterium]